MGQSGTSRSGSPNQNSSSKSNDLMGGFKSDMMGGSGGLSSCAGSSGGLGDKTKYQAGSSSGTAKKDKDGSGSSSGNQSFLDGTFNCGWQSNADIPDRRRVIYSICKVIEIEQMQPDARQMSQK